MPNPLDPFGSADLLRNLGTQLGNSGSALSQLARRGTIQDLLAKQGHQFKLKEAEATGTQALMNTLLGKNIANPQAQRQLQLGPEQSKQLDLSRIIGLLAAQAEAQNQFGKAGIGVDFGTPKTPQPNAPNVLGDLLGNLKLPIRQVPRTAEVSGLSAAQAQTTTGSKRKIKSNEVGGVPSTVREVTTEESREDTNRQKASTVGKAREFIDELEEQGASKQEGTYGKLGHGTRYVLGDREFFVTDEGKISEITK